MADNPATDWMWQALSEAEKADRHDDAHDLMAMIDEEESKSTGVPAQPSRPTTLGEFPGFASGDQPPIIGPSKEKEAMAARGIDVQTGAPAGDFKAGFSPNQQSRYHVYQNALNKYFGEPVEITPDMASGKLTYKHPQTGLPTLIDDGGFSVGGSLPMAGGIAGSLTPAPWAGSILGTGLGEGARLGLGAAMGANEGANTEEVAPGQIGPTNYRAWQMAKDAAKASEEAAVGAVPFLTAVKLPGLTSWFLKGKRPFNPGVAEKLLADSASTEKLVQDVRKMAGSDEFSPFVSQRANNFEALRMQDSVLNDPRLNVDLIKKFQANTGEIKKALQNITPESGNFGSEMTTEVARMDKDLRRVAAEQNLAEGQGRLGKIVEDFPRMTPAEMRDEIDPVIQAKNDALKEESKKLHGVRDVSSENANPMPPEWFRVGKGGDWYKLVKKLQTEMKFRLSAKERAGLKQVTPSGLPRPVETPDELLLKDLGQLTQDRAVGIPAINAHISFLRQEISNRAAGRATVSADTPTLYALKDAAFAARAQFLKSTSPKVLDDIEKAEAAAEAQGTFERNMIGNGFLKSLQGQSGTKMAPRILEKLERDGDVKGAQELMDAVGHDANAKNTLNQYALSSFKNLFKPDKQGNINITAATLDKAGKSKLEVLKTFMTPESLEAIEKTFDAQKSVYNYALKVKQVDKDFNESFAGRLGSYNGEGLSTAILGKGEQFGLADVYKLKSYSDRVGTLESTKRSVMGRLREDITGSGGNDFHPDKLHELVQDSSRMAKLEAFLGKDYAGKLRTLDEALTVATRTSKGAAGQIGERSYLTDWARFLYAHPLTMEGRGLTLLTGMRKNAFSRAISKGLSDPEEFKKLIEFSRVYSDSNRAAVLAASLRSSLLAGPDVMGNVEIQERQNGTK